MVRLSASASMCATISTSPLAASVATQVTSPSASNFGVRARPSSISFDAADMLVSWRLLHGQKRLPGFHPAIHQTRRNESRRLSLNLALGAAHRGQEAQLFIRIVAESAAELRCHSERAGLLDAAQRH